MDQYIYIYIIYFSEPVYMYTGLEYKRLMAARGAHKMLRATCTFGAEICNTLARVACTGMLGHAFKED